MDLNYLNIPDKWPVKFETNLTQSEIISLQLGGFVLEDGHTLQNPAPSPFTTVVSLNDVDVGDAITVKDPPTATFSLPDVALQFNPSLSRDKAIPLSEHNYPAVDGDKCPTLRDGKPIRFVSQPSAEHLKKMEDHKNISCLLMKYIKVPSPGYGIVMTICILGSAEQKELYEVSILDYPSC